MALESNRFIAGAALAIIVVIAGGCGDPVNPEPLDAVSARQEWAGNPDLSRTLAAVRAATAGFHDVDAALAAGYILGSPCEANSEGAMGHHYPNPALIGIRGVRGSPPLVWGVDPVIDPVRPEVLLYEPQADGSKKLVGVEYVVFAEAWDAVNSSPPTLAGIPFHYAAGEHAHGFEPHYELHVWLWRHNPLGIAYPWNPRVSCSP